VCGGSMAGRRAHALTCSDACRKEAERLRAILAGEAAAPYPSIRARLSARGRRSASLLR
jgi:hypothetical protein